MREIFVPKDIAQKLKEKGFDEDCLAMYNDRYHKGELTVIGQHEGSGVTGDSNSNFNNNQRDFEVCTAPTFEQVQNWFREKHNLHFYVVPYGDMRTWSISGLEGWEFPNMARIDKKERDDRLFYDVRQKYMNVKFNTYYEALTEAINEGLKVI
jgi:hypothetical protein